MSGVFSAVFEKLLGVGVRVNALVFELIDVVPVIVRALSAPALFSRNKGPNLAGMLIRT